MTEDSLEKRLRRAAEVNWDASALLLEAADALARVERRATDWEASYGSAEARISQLERELAALRASWAAGHALHAREGALIDDLQRELAARENVNFAFDATMRRAEAAEARLAPFAERIQVLAADVMRERDSRMAAEARLAAAQDIVREALADMSNQRAAIGPQRGMHVPWHGRFAGANPSVCKDIDRALTAISVALATPALPEET
jgi:chromosome segregation ATPase